MTRGHWRELGDLRARPPSERSIFGAVWRRARMRAEGGCWLRELNRVEWGIGWRSGGLEEREVPHGCTRRCADG